MTSIGVAMPISHGWTTSAEATNDSSNSLQRPAPRHSVFWMRSASGYRQSRLPASRSVWRRDTFTNINARISRLEQSTIQSVVLDSQQKFRVNNRTTGINSRPAAIYHLRNYLRICLPFSIETTVNNTVAVFHRAGANALSDNTIFTRQVMTDSTKRFSRQPRVRVILLLTFSIRTNGTCRWIKFKGFQLALCQKDDGILEVARTRARQSEFIWRQSMNRVRRVRSPAELRCCLGAR